MTTLSINCYSSIQYIVRLTTNSIAEDDDGVDDNETGKRRRRQQNTRSGIEWKQTFENSMNTKSDTSVINSNTLQDCEN